MWKLIEISQHPYFIDCKITNSQEVTFILYDLKETWCESLTFHEVKQNVKLLNKRYDFNEANIRETLLNGEIQTAIIEQQPHTSSTKQESCVVKLKYLVKNCPFHLEWSLRRQTLGEFQTTFMQPLFTALQGCFQQVEILTEVLRKKDAELTQYRKEGAILHRKTLATKTFDFDDFTQKYKVSTELAVNYTELAKFVLNTKPNVGVGFLNAQSISIEPTKNEVLLEENTISPNNANTKMSPKQRKRKVHEIKQQQLERQLKVRKQQFEYESSQSQTTNSQSNDESLKIATEQQKDSKEELQSTPKKEKDSESGYKYTPRRKTTRCAPIRNYEESKSSDDQTDSDNDESNQITMRQRKSTRNFNTAEMGTSPNGEKCKEPMDNKTKSSAAGDTCDKSTKSPTLSYNSVKKSSSGKVTPSSNRNLNTTEMGTSPNGEKCKEAMDKTKSSAAGDTCDKSTKSPTKRCAPIRNYEESKSSDDQTDSDNDESNKITVRQRKSTRNLNTAEMGTSPNGEKCKEPMDNETKRSAAGDKSTKSPTLSYNSVKKSSSGKVTPSSNNVYDFSTDSEYEKSTKIRRKLLKTSLSITENRKTRSAPHVFTESEVKEQRKSLPSNNSVDNKSKNLSHLSPPVTDDISSQLDAIKKELKSLEALRLADLQQRMCKA